MSYATYRLPYFSNPNIKYPLYIDDYSTGQYPPPKVFVGDFALGVPLTEDYPAYAALTVSELAPYKAQIRNLKPVLIQVPPTTCAVTHGEVVSVKFRTFNSGWMGAEEGFWDGGMGARD